MAAVAPTPIQSTAGAVPVRNEKGEISMQKVKVHRYVSGKRPEYAPASSSEEESDDEFVYEQKRRRLTSPELSNSVEDESDPRLRRLRQRQSEVDTEDRLERHRVIHAPEVLSSKGEDVEEEEEDEVEEIEQEVEIVEETSAKKAQRPRGDDDDDSTDNEELNEDQIEERRAMMRTKVRDRLEKEQEALETVPDDEGKSDEEETEEESEYEDYTDSEEEASPRLKPVFVRKKERITIQEKEALEQKEKELEVEAKRVAEERRKNSLKLVENEARKEIQESKINDQFAGVDSADENDEAEYEQWKLRELKRIKRERDDRETRERERLEIERVHTMTEEERRAEFRSNPKVLVNKAIKGKYKFLQKYYHRGAFYMDVDDGVFKRDFAQPTLEDHFDKTILPKVMQVKNFGRSGRTKYTHLLDQDTTQFESPWSQETGQNLKFHANQAGGMKQVFDRPSGKKHKK
ncbi:Microfibrillar-associated protein 1 [Chamberlinius hualienensis]